MLTYLFRAHFADGSYYTQGASDTAQIAERGSAFSDVLHLQHAGAKLVAFELFYNPELGDVTSYPIAAVHLDTGHFELTGNQFYAGVDGLEDGIERRLIYYRQVTQIREQDVIADTGEPCGDWRDSTLTRFVIGWQATIDGRNVQHMIALDG